MEYETMLCKTALSPSRLPGLKYSLNPYFGCEHGCLYCYARSVFHDEEVARTWGTFVKAKRNIAEVLAKELRRRDRGTIGLSTVTDPYQPIESRLELTRACLQILKSSGFKVSIQTKSSQVLRDADLISGPLFEVGVTVTTMNPDLSRKLEPRASPPDERQQILEKYHEERVETWIFLGPIIPGVNDQIEGIKQIIRIAKSTDSRLLFDKLNLRPHVLQSLSPFLVREAPASLKNLSMLLSKKSDYWSGISAKVVSLCQNMGVRCEPAFPWRSDLDPAYSSN